MIWGNLILQYSDKFGPVSNSFQGPIFLNLKYLYKNKFEMSFDNSLTKLSTIKRIGSD